MIEKYTIQKYIISVLLFLLLPLVLAQPTNQPEDLARLEELASKFNGQFNEDNKEFSGESGSAFSGGIPSELINGFTQPLQEAIQPLINIAKYILGGIFGLYFLLIIIRIYYERKKVNLLKDLRFDLDHLNKHFNVPHSAHRKGSFGRLWARLRGKA